MLSCNRLCIDPCDGSPVVEYRIEDECIESRTLETAAEHGLHERGRAGAVRWKRGFRRRRRLKQPLRDLRCFLLPLYLPVLSNKRKSALQFGSEISGLSGDLNGLASRFAPQPARQFFPRSLHAPTIVGNGHPGFGPSLSY
jgi:hypothetical protein